MNPLMLVSIALAISMAGNLLLTKSYLGARDDRIQAVADRDSARDAARECSRNTDRLTTLADERKKEATAARDEAAELAGALDAAADALLKRRPSVPTDDCRSAAVQMDDWFSSKGVKK